MNAPLALLNSLTKRCLVHGHRETDCTCTYLLRQKKMMSWQY